MTDSTFPQSPAVRGALKRFYLTLENQRLRSANAELIAALRPFACKCEPTFCANSHTEHTELCDYGLARAVLMKIGEL